MTVERLFLEPWPSSDLLWALLLIGWLVVDRLLVLEIRVYASVIPRR